MYRLFVSIICGLLFFSLQAQKLSINSKKAIAFYKEAINLYQFGKLEEAIDQLDLALKKEEDFIEAYLLKADIFESLQRYDSQIASYLTVMQIDSTFFPYTRYNLGKAYLYNGQYNKAKQVLLQFLDQKNIKPISLAKAQMLCQRCDTALYYLKHPVPFKAIKLSDSINTWRDEYWASLSADESYMVYTTLKTDSTKINLYGQYGLNEDIYISHRKKGAWGKGVPIPGRLNTENNEGAPRISSDGKVIVFTACNRHDGFGQCDIYFAFLTPKGWSYPVNAGPEINTQYSEKQAALSPDNRELYFSSNRPGGKGKLDIWKSEVDASGRWQKPVNMGEIINTGGDDMSAFIHGDNESLYFSSEGHPGLGKNDIFLSRKDSNGIWGAPQNIGYPINNYKDNIGLVINNAGDLAYYSTDDSAGVSNIYQFTIPENIRPRPASYVSGLIYDEESRKGLQATFYLVNNDTRDTVMLGQSDKENGEFLVCIPVGKNYAFLVDHKDYLYYSQNFALADSSTALDPLHLDVGLKKIKAGESIVLHNIFFAHDSYDLLPASYVEIEKLRQLLVQNPGLKVEIGGHTDNTASSEYNKDLSVKRAKAVMDALDLEANLRLNVSYKGYGEDFPIGDNNTAEGRAENRRTELKIMGNTP